MSIVLNIHYLLISIHLGYVMGVAPLISYFYGAKDYDKVNIFIKYSKRFILVTCIVSAVGCLLFGKYIVMIFERPGSELFDIALTGVRFLSGALLLCGANICLLYTSFEDIFDMFGGAFGGFGGGSRGSSRRNGPRKGSDLQKAITLSLIHI